MSAHRELPPQTAESIAAALAAQREERRRVFQQTGVWIDDAGHVWLTPAHGQAHDQVGESRAEVAP